MLIHTKAFIIHSSFIAYRNLYNLIGRMKDYVYYSTGQIPKPLPRFLWVDLKCWHLLPEHPCHRARKHVRDIFILTGMKPKDEYMYLLEET